MTAAFSTPDATTILRWIGIVRVPEIKTHALAMRATEGLFSPLPLIGFFRSDESHRFARWRLE
jgi:hypothetical protein